MDGDVTTIDRMVRDRMPVDLSNGVGFATLHWATMFNRTDVIKHLLHEGADMNIQTRYENTPLHWAARSNSTEATRMLIDNGADVNLKNNDNKTPLDVARKGTEVERLLLQVQQSTS